MQEVKLTPETLDIIKNFSQINPSLLFKKGNVLSTISSNKTILAKAKLNQEFEDEFGIFELSKFMGVLNLFKDPDIQTSPTVLKIKSDNKTIRYTCADPKNFSVPPDKEIRMKSVDVQFTLEPEVFASVQKAIAILGFSQFGIVGSEGKLSLQAMNTANPTGDVYSVEIGVTDKNFMITIRNDFLKLIPGKYEVKISKAGLSMFEGEFVTYWIPVEETSTFE